MKIKNYFSPNVNKAKRSIKSIKLVVIHYTGMQSERESLKRLCNPKFKVSCHYLITKNGTIYRLVEENKIAWHAGKSRWRKFKNLNKNSVGIELTNKGHQFGYTNFTKKQLSTLIKICTSIIKKYKIEKKNIVGHSDIAPLRKIDPGEKFPWQELSKKHIGIWHSHKLNFLKKFRKINNNKKKDRINFIKNLNRIGYYVPKNYEPFLTKIVKAFQRRYRQELINGKIDEECLLIANNLSKNL
jgi:N-acetylmuramoyl-L-alanine amidase